MIMIMTVIMILMTMIMTMQGDTLLVLLSLGCCLLHLASAANTTEQEHKQFYRAAIRAFSKIMFADFSLHQYTLHFLVRFYKI